jgi:predicted ATPase
LGSLVAGLADRRMLVCLDNCEHVIDAVAALVEAVLDGCPDVTLLLTSREPLGLAGEAVWGVPALAIDEAYALFVARGAEVQPGFAPDQDEAEAVCALCARLDGIPRADRGRARRSLRPAHPRSAWRGGAPGDPRGVHGLEPRPAGRA